MIFDGWFGEVESAANCFIVFPLHDEGEHVHLALGKTDLVWRDQRAVARSGMQASAAKAALKSHLGIGQLRVSILLVISRMFFFITFSILLFVEFGFFCRSWREWPGPEGNNAPSGDSFSPNNDRASPLCR